MENNLIPAQNLPPFLKFCCTVGILPTSYKISWTYEEQVLECIRFIKEEVIPVINKNALATTELQEKFVELVNYVETYLENLDVQKEINNKLDEMVQDGTLSQIINNQIFTELNNKVQENTNNITENTTQINGILNTKNKPFNMNKVIFIGDSYASRDNNWVNPLISKLGLQSNEYYIGALGSSGFVHQNNGKNFLSLLQDIVGTIPSDLNNISHVIVCGGANDSLDEYSNILEKINEFSNYVNTNLPNAKLYIGEIGWTSDSTKIIDYSKVIDAYTKCNENNNCYYLNNVHYTLHNYTLLETDKVHPTNIGCQELANSIHSALMTGSCNIIYTQNKHSINIGSGSFNVYETINNNMCSVYSNARNLLLGLTFDTILANGANFLTLGENIFDYVLGSYFEQNRTFIECIMTINGTREIVPCNIGINNNNLLLYPISVDLSSGEYRTLTNITAIIIPQFNIVMNSLNC